MTRFNPFPGLRPFTQEEDYLFFGREEQTTELLELLRAHRFIAVVGTSGSGKSSLVRAGLLPALFGGTMVTVGSRWDVTVFRPGGDPIRNLAHSLADCDLYDAEDPETIPRVLATLRRSRTGLVEAIKQSDLPDGHNLLIVVDQFEELFRFRQTSLNHQDQATEFVHLLLNAASASEIPIYIAMTMRSDYLGECAQIPGLAEAVNSGEYLIPKLTRDQRRDAIERPVAVGGGSISSRLINQLLNEVGDEVDQLPVLQHALMRVWDAWEASHVKDDALDIHHYEAVGGLNHALSQHADEVYGGLPSERSRGLCEHVFKALTERGDDDRGIRRPTRMDLLCEIVGGEHDEILEVLDAYRKSGRTFVMPLEDVAISNSTVVDISHESLMRAWQRLTTWVEEESQSARIYRRLADTATLFDDNRAGHYRDPDLQIALSWRNEDSPTAAWGHRYHRGFPEAIRFLEESENVAHAEEREREAQRQKELEQAKALAAAQKKARQRSQIITVLSIAAAIIVGFLWNDAANQRQEAVNAKWIAEEQRDRANDLAKSEAIAKEAETRQRAVAESETVRANMALYAATIRQVQSDLDTQQGRRVAGSRLSRWEDVRTTTGTPDAPSMRDWEWFFLKSELNKPHPSVPVRYLRFGSSINSNAVWSPDGSKIAIAGPHQTLIILDGTTFEITKLIPRRQSRFIPRLSWSPDATQVALLNWWDNTSVYDVETGLCTVRIDLTTPGSTSLAWHPVLPRLAMGVNDNKIGIFDTQTGDLLSTVNTTSAFIMDIVWNQTGSRLAWGGADGKAAVHAFPSLAEVVKSDHFSTRRNMFHWLSDNKRIIVNTADSGFGVWDPDTNETGTIPGDLGIGSVIRIAVHPTKDWVAFGSMIGTVVVWDVAENRQLYEFKDLDGIVTEVNWDPTGSKLMVCRVNERIAVYDVAGETPPYYDTAAPDPKPRAGLFTTISQWMPSGQTMSVAHPTDGKIAVLDPDTKKVVDELQTPFNSRITAHAWSASGKYLATASKYVIAISTPDAPSLPLTELRVQDASEVILTLAWSQDDRFLTSSSGYLRFTDLVEPTPVEVWDLQTLESPKLIRLKGHQSQVTAVAWHPTKPLLATGGMSMSDVGSAALLWDFDVYCSTGDTPSPAALASPLEQVTDLEFSPDGEQISIAYAQRDGIYGVDAKGVVNAVDLSTLAVTTFPTQPDLIYDVDWSISSQRLVTAGFDGQVKLWRLDGVEILSLPTLTKDIYQVHWSPDNRTLAVENVHKDVQTWDIIDGLSSASVTDSPALLNAVFNSTGNRVAKVSEFMPSVYAYGGEIDRAYDAHLRLIESGARLATYLVTPYYISTAISNDTIHDKVDEKTNQTNYVPQTDILTSYINSASFSSANRRTNIEVTKWHPVRSKGREVPFPKSRTSSKYSHRFVSNQLLTDKATTAYLTCGNAGHLYVWKRHESEQEFTLVFKTQHASDANPSDNVVPITLEKGSNEILIDLYSTGMSPVAYLKWESQPEVIYFDARAANNHALLQELTSNKMIRRLLVPGGESDLSTQLGDMSSALTALRGIPDTMTAKAQTTAYLLFDDGRFQAAADAAKTAYDLQQSNTNAMIYGKSLAYADAVTLIPRDAVWQTLHSDLADFAEDDFVNLYANFSRGDFDASEWTTWPEAAMVFGFSNNAFYSHPLARAAKNASAHLFRTTFNSDIDLEAITLETCRAHGFTVYLDGEVVFRCNLPDGVPHKSLAPDNTPHLSQPATYCIPADIAAGTHTIGISIHPLSVDGNVWVSDVRLLGFKTRKLSVPPNVSTAVQASFLLWRAIATLTANSEVIATTCAALEDPFLLFEPQSKWLNELTHNFDMTDGKFIAAIMPFYHAVRTNDSDRYGELFEKLIELDHTSLLSDLIATWLKTYDGDEELQYTRLLLGYAGTNQPLSNEQRAAMIAANKTSPYSRRPEFLLAALCAQPLTTSEKEAVSELSQRIDPDAVYDEASKFRALPRALLAFRLYHTNDVTIKEIEEILALRPGQESIAAVNVTDHFLLAFYHHLRGDHVKATAALTAAVHQHDVEAEAIQEALNAREFGREIIYQQLKGEITALLDRSE